MKSVTKMMLSMVVAALVFASVAQAGLIKVEGMGKYLNIEGGYAGEIKVTPTGIDGVADGQSFYTFCLEFNEPIYFNETYNAVTNTMAIKGGESVCDPLSAKTAWLYYQYYTGAIKLNTNTDAANFQIAIWKLEDENLPHSIHFTDGAKYYYNLALASDWTDLHSVRVLNVTKCGEYCQDLLVPEPATMILLGLGTVLCRKAK